jgi:hypothetical protein
MTPRLLRFVVITLHVTALACPVAASAQNSTSSRNSSSQASQSQHSLDLGSVKASVYRNAALGFFCKIPEGWVLRTDDLNAPDETAEAGNTAATRSKSNRVLLAAFSRPPQAKGEDVNASILIAAESAAAYPGLQQAAQYFGPLTEVAKAQGFTITEEPYEFSVGAKTLVRGDFEKNVGSRVMHQSTLVVLARGYVISFTFIGGTEDEVEELVSGLNFSATGKTTK